MDKLSEYEPEPEEQRIYRLRTNDEKYQEIYKCKCYSWDDNLWSFVQTPMTIEWMEEGIENDELIWTVEYLEDVEESFEELELEENDNIPIDSLFE